MVNAHATEPLDRGTIGPDRAPETPEPATAIKTPSLTDADPDVGLSQKGLGEDAVIRRETEV